VPGAGAGVVLAEREKTDGRYNIPKGDPDYQPKLDRDNDGLACEG
jgi:hypothetical protein